MLENVGEDVANVLSLINAIDDAPMGQARMWVDEPADDDMAGYRRLAAGVITQLAHDATRAAAVNLAGVLQALAWLSCQEEYPVWAHVLNLDAEDLSDGIMRRLERRVSAAAD